MDLLPSNEQEEIASAVRSFLTRTQAAPDREGMLRYATEPLDRTRWVQMAELGWFGLGLSEEFGGTG
jgi:alkylation response protein AidB-like acyl-CoA dehydrogenase